MEPALKVGAPNAKGPLSQRLAGRCKSLRKVPCRPRSLAPDCNTAEGLWRRQLEVMLWWLGGSWVRGTTCEKSEAVGDKFQNTLQLL